MGTDRPRNDREFDVVVYGATGFTGRLVAEYLAEHYTGEADLRWAVAARSPGKLRHVMSEIGVDAGRVPQIVADSESPASLAELAGRSRVVLTTVGPYAKFGTPLVEACVRGGVRLISSASSMFVKMGPWTILVVTPFSVTLIF